MHKRRMQPSTFRVTSFRATSFLPLLAAALLLGGAGCHPAPRDPHTVTLVIESSPTSLDPRVGVDAQSEHLDMLIFDSLVRKDAHFNLQPDLAQSWETPDLRTYVFTPQRRALP